jgi:hypothetical protein
MARFGVGSARRRTEELFALDRLVEENLAYYLECASDFRTRRME